MEYKFEKYNYQSRVVNKEPIIRIHSSSLMTLTAAFMRTYGLGDYRYINMYYDKDAKIIGLKFENEGGMKLARSRNGVSLTRTVNVAGFLFINKIELPVEEEGGGPSTSFEVKPEEYIDAEIGEIFLIKLNKN